MKHAQKQNTPKETPQESIPDQPVPHEGAQTPADPFTPQKPALPPTFPKPPRTAPFAQGTKLRQDNRNRFFSRTRRGSI